MRESSVVVVVGGATRGVGAVEAAVGVTDLEAGLSEMEGIAFSCSGEGSERSSMGVSS